MCNTYRISRKSGASGLVRQVNEAAAKLVSDLVSKSDPGVVVRADGHVELMRWGFHREFNPAINNARSGKLEGGMWKEAFHERRGLIPMSLFYEWGPGTDGRKQAHEIRDPESESEWLWAAGIWENGAGELGPCYSMITTEANAVMAPVHSRMPALLPPDIMQDWLAGGRWDFQPFPGPLVVEQCESPLARNPDPAERQGELL